ncbi:ProQ/FinO family protein [Citrobacter freundii]|uniref:ProQ/FINO family protein n=1 Tax=Citrobacter freundii complex TaxID=1344959 RepID=UPI0006662C42|nr:MULTISPECIES: ProQ/FINO family protein [Citrobacter freundii complex]EKY0657868.1 ProQ/FinO family protein [Citrobacter freundii]ELT9540842.1 ProQ/FinO family protein [Citrobacter freundii]MEB7914149.1 ProQ/FinO family protein [Citrobacter portucalensis]
MDTKRQILRLKRATTSATAKPSANTATAEKTAHASAGAATGTKSSRHNRKKLELLVTHWPAAFSLDAPRPLAIGTAELIAADICARGIAGAGKIRAAVAMYTRRAIYLRALIAGGSRYNLAGEPVGVVTPEQQRLARENLSAMNGKISVRGDHAPDA